ncbi:hypothetical protein M0R45_013072 [Rubus argutus]|uniref:DUF4220 domain-containing protein n=1 Tax=Rubus argutus TaxID=59490 RepID=A0AAW1XIK6_RUBAR
MVNPLPPVVKKVWEKWNLRGFVLLSLSLQITLILGAPFRKRTPNMGVTFVIWSSYLLADWAANFAIGLIANSQGDNPLIPSPNNNGGFNSDLLAFGLPFFCYNLGGPDTITAFALEDNTLWLRHLFGLVFQVIAAVYVFIQSFPKNKLWLPTVLLFLAGIIKYAERTRALYLASLDNFKESMLKKPDPGPNYAKLMEEYSSKKDAKLPTHIELTPERSKESRTTTYVVDEGEMNKDIALVRHAFFFFNIFKGLIVDLIFSFHERFESRVFFHNRSPEQAFKIVAIELNFMYEALFTKVVVVHSKRGYLCRAISFSAVCTALVCFQKIEKHDFHGFDVGITYILLFGALALDSIAVFMLTFSDWTAAFVKKSCLKSYIDSILEKYLNLKKPRWCFTPKSKGGTKVFGVV